MAELWLKHQELIMSTPFVLCLLTIAAGPLLAPHAWEHNKTKAIWMAAFSLPVVVWMLATHPASELAHSAFEYIEFMSVLLPLYMAAGGVYIEGRVKATPAVNTLVLALGSLVALCIGTLSGTLLTMFFLRRINEHRKYSVHTYLFVICSVSNLAGLLLPVGPPLFLAMQKGLDFQWFAQHLWKYWVVCQVLQLALYYVVELIQHGKEPSTWNDTSEDPEHHPGLGIVGFGNVLILGLMVLTIAWKMPSELKMLVLWTMGLIAFFVVPNAKRARDDNKFTWGPAVEVTVLFAGIFATMIPALMYLQHHGAEFGLSKPLEFFICTGLLSGFLDNAPTLLCFLEVGKSTFGNGGEMTTVQLAEAQPLIVIAMCLGAVIFGALSYIGNAPNFLVKALAEEKGVKMPNFFVHVLLSGIILLVTAVIPVGIILSCGGF